MNHSVIFVDVTEFFCKLQHLSGCNFYIRADDTFRLRCTFRFAGEDEARTLNIVIDAVSVEVIAE